jgi:hypothetical protein
MMNRRRLDLRLDRLVADSKGLVGISSRQMEFHPLRIGRGEILLLPASLLEGLQCLIGLAGRGRKFPVHETRREVVTPRGLIDVGMGGLFGGERGDGLVNRDQDGRIGPVRPDGSDQQPVRRPLDHCQGLDVDHRINLPGAIALGNQDESCQDTAAIASGRALGDGCAQEGE